MNKTQKIIATAAITLGTASIAIPASADSGNLSPLEIKNIWIAQGGPSSQATMACAVAEVESGGNPNAYNASGAIGLYQLLGHGGTTNPYQNTAVAVKLYKATGWYNSWLQYQPSGAYTQHLSECSVGDSSRSTGSQSAPQRSSEEKAPTQTYSAPDSNSEGSVTYTVKSGDTLSTIGAHYDVSWQSIYKSNEKVIGDNPDLIFPDQKFTFTI